jgi:predicted site-specific integrase-resolvase
LVAAWAWHEPDSNNNSKAKMEHGTTLDGTPTQKSIFKAVKYVRMSTDHQQYSTENQSDKIDEYAERRGIEILRTYADEGKSGLRIEGRPRLQELIKLVESGQADFQIILVYDISRWGRFQDADESAYYEYICRRAGIQVAYCAEQFENDGSPVSTIVKGVTYNNRVNRLSTVQEHLMIKRAINRGVSPEKLANSLNVDLSHIMRKVKLLDGICAEAAELLRDQVFSAKLSDVLRKMKPTRQVECVELMISANNITIPYAEALLAASPAHFLVGEIKPKKVRGVNAEQMLKMEREMGNLQEQYKLVEESYGQDVLNLVLAKGYLVRLIENNSVARYIQQNQPDVFTEFVNIVETVSLDK